MRIKMKALTIKIVGHRCQVNFLKVLAVTGMWLWSVSLMANDDFKYARSLSGITDTWHQIVIPDDVFRNAGEELKDLRILGVTPDKDTVEAPYILTVKKGETKTKQVDFATINNSKKAGKQYITFSITKKEYINRIQLDLGNRNFDWKINLEGSHDQKEWFTILEDYRILSIDTDRTKYTYTTLHFPAASYGFFRVTFPVTEVKLERASLVFHESTEPDYRTYDGFEVSKQNDKETKETVLDIVLAHAVPVSLVGIAVKDELDYYRPISIEVVRDSTASPKGWIYNYRNVYNGVINSIEPPEFSFNSVTTRMIRVRIRNYDNTPLDIGEILIEGFQHELTARFSEQAEYSLRYGNSSLQRPNYDIVQFINKIPEELKALTIGPEVRIGKDAPKPKPAMNSKLWLWGILVLIVLVLGWFTLGMIRK